ncbi:hypothetical protein OAY95_04480 [Candidatus Pelagibacter sp.]|nr:hypothetical protein [Candidatus Pelagibacter sp.]
MSNDKLFSILDFGSSKLRLGIFKNYLNNSKFISEIDSLDNFEFKSHNEKQKQNLQDLIIKTEKEINQHMNNINVMFDCPKILFIDFSIKKDMDKIKSDNSVFKNILQEAKQIIEEKNKNYKILHIIISKYILDGIEFDNMPENIIIEEAILELKFILAPNIILDSIKELLKDNHISINNFYNSTYVKTLNYTSYFESFDIKTFIDVGYKKTSLALYKNNKLLFLDFLHIGGDHITKDISKVLKKKYNESEILKKSLIQKEVTFINDEQNHNLLIKIIHARIEEIIDLCFKNITDIESIKNKKSILIFTGEGSKILSKNSIYLKEKYNIFDDLNFFEENCETICTSAFNYESSNNFSEAIIMPKKQRKTGLFERFFYMFSR